jgi:sec-independent protein translocase protein TatB
MLNIGFPELILIAIVALLVVGPSKLPEVARTVGKALGEFRRMADGVKESWQEEISKEDVDKTIDQSADGHAERDQCGTSENVTNHPSQDA